jgi:hypothetical protein
VVTLSTSGNSIAFAEQLIRGARVGTIGGDHRK